MTSEVSQNFSTTSANGSCFNSTQLSNTSESSTSEDLSESALSLKVLDLLQRIEFWSLIGIIPLGIILNTTSFILFYKMKFYTKSSGFCLMCIAVADSFAILNSYLNNINRHEKVLFPNVLILSKEVCIFNFFLLVSSYLWSAILLALATIERFLSIAFALKIKTWNMLKLSKIFSALSFVICATTGGITATNLQLIDFPNGLKCSVPESKMHLFSALMKFITGLNVFASSLIFLFTILIAVNLFKQKEVRNELTEGRQPSQSRREKKITFMLFLVACLFILTRIPENIIYNILDYYETRQLYNNKVYKSLVMAYPLVLFLYTCNHSFNFVIYIFFFKQFRRTLICGDKNSRQTSEHRDISRSSGHTEGVECDSRF